jgi:hypothetical protein
MPPYNTIMIPVEKLSLVVTSLSADKLLLDITRALIMSHLRRILRAVAKEFSFRKE